MIGFDRFKSLWPLLLSTILLSSYLFFAFYQWEEAGSKFILATYRRTRLKQRALLDNVLKNAAMPNKTVIITSLNQAWAEPNSIIDLFLESFRVGQGTRELLDHLVIVAMDDESFERCKSIHKHCYNLRIRDIDFSPEKRFMTPDFLKWMWRRLAFLQLVLELGYNFIFTDADIMWFRNPIPIMFSQNADITMATDLYTGNPTDTKNIANTGLNYVVSNTRTINFYSHWYMSKRLYPKLNEQPVFDTIKQDSIVKKIRPQIRYLDLEYFGGFCRRPSFQNVRTFHANCCVGVTKKLQDLRLVIEDWINFTALSVEDKGRLNYTWRAPSKCIMP